MRLLSPDDACVSVKVPTGRSVAQYDGTTINVTDRAHIRALRQAGYTVAGTSSAPVRHGGYDCTECSFRSFFRRCSRCGHQS
jgi:hypothetical protein